MATKKRDLELRRRLVSRLVFFEITFLLAFIFLSCSSDQKDSKKQDTSTSSLKTEILKTVALCAEDVFSKSLQNAQDLEEHVKLALNSEDELLLARESWKKTMDFWQQAEVMQFGPLGPTSGKGGKGLRDLIYSWPYTSPCSIDQMIVSRSYDDPNFLSASLIHTRSLSALEYLLFYAGENNACAPQQNINKNGEWAKLNKEEKRHRRLSYAAKLALDLRQKIQYLVDEWDVSKGNFEQKFIQAGQKNSVYTTQGQAFNAVSDALFYIELETRDMKVAKVAGIMGCNFQTCVDAEESPFSSYSKQNIQQNLLGFEKVFLGCQEAGNGSKNWGDLLISLGLNSLSEKIRTELADTKRAADELTSSLREAASSNPAQLQKLYDEMSKLVRTLKTEVVSVLDLELPEKLEGDND